MMSFPLTLPEDNFVPFGYIDNPWHMSVLHRSGVVRSVPPMGFGFWRRSMPFGYGQGVRPHVNYLSFLHPSFVIDGTPFHVTEDFQNAGVRLVSRRQTKNVRTFDASFHGVDVRLTYYLNGEHTLCCRVEMENAGADTRRVTLHASHIYGYPEVRWWGADGVASRFHDGSGAAVAKFWAYGDVFALCADLPGLAYKATASPDEWRQWSTSDDLCSTDGASSTSPDPVFSLLSGALDLAAGARWCGLLTLTCGVNEPWTLAAARDARASAATTLDALLAEDAAFYEAAPVLRGDWPDAWRRGWLYDLETLRMNVRRPAGIFRHHWDAMQIFTPRAVLAETVLDALCLSYADPALAKDMALGVFADAPFPNVPCVREDGSMNMVSMGGEECGTAPIWVLPFRTIQAMYERDGGDAWLAALYPHLEAFVQWWLDNRTDETGRFFCNNSWESGQDGSQRFLIERGEEGKETEYVQTVDVEAAMADAMRTLAALATPAGRPGRAGHWRALAEQRAETTRAMFVDGGFRDFDARTGQPIVLPDYHDVMMLLPLSVGIATPEQTEAVKARFQWFMENPRHWLEWPSFLFCFTEAGWNAGLRPAMAEVVARTADRVYARIDHPAVAPVTDERYTMPEPYRFRIPGSSNEYWPLEPATLAECGAEAYGWGATLPTLILRNILGFREDGASFTLCPTLPPSLHVPGRAYTVTNLRYRAARFDVTMEPLAEGRVRLTVFRHDGAAPVRWADAFGTPLDLHGGADVASAGIVRGTCDPAH